MSKFKEAVLNEIKGWIALRIIASTITLKLWLPALLVLLWFDVVTLQSAMVSAVSVTSGSLATRCLCASAVEAAENALKTELEKR